MKFSCEKNMLQSAISIVSRAAATKSSIPALEGLLLHCENSTLTISAYNMQLGIRTHFSCDVEENGALVLDTRLFGEIVRRMPDDTLTLHADDKLAVKLHCGDADFDVTALPADDFPQLPEIDGENAIALPEKTLAAIVRDTIFSLSTDETRPVHTGSLFEVAGRELTVVSVDGYRLALRREHLEQSDGTFSFIVPGIALREAESICEDVDTLVTITPGERHILFEIGDTELICRRLNGEFLDYQNAVPRNQAIRLTVDTRTMTESLDRVGVVISEKLKSPVRCLFGDGSVTFCARTPNGEAKDVCKLDGNGQELEIGFNNRYLCEALRHAPADRVCLELGSAISPAVILPEQEDDESFLYMVLPVRLKA